MADRLKEFEVRVAEDFYLAVKLHLVRGQLVAFVVRLMKHGDPDVNVARYDTAHGLPHRDVLGRRKGPIRKDWLLGWSNAEALIFALNDLKSNHERYAEIYETN